MRPASFRQALRFVLLIGWIAAASATSPHAAAETEHVFELTTAGEAVAEILALSPQASWARPGAEAAVVTLYVNGEYNQDIVLFQGERPWAYRVFLGPLEAGRHRVRATRNPRWSAPHAGVQIDRIDVDVIPPGHPEHRALAHAPILYARADTLGSFSDLPLLMWYERLEDPKGETLQYSVIFSNEDGGTPTDALMARWGRATDIEHVYRARFDPAGTLVEEIFQGPGHEDLPFRGQKLGRHPFLLVVTQNNMFTDRGYSPLQYRLLPVEADLRGSSREGLMHRFPWTYRLMSQELEREGKLRSFGETGSTAVGDPRHYLYIELRAENRETGMLARVKLLGRPEWYSSHRGQLDFTLGRSGWLRTTVELPPGTEPGSVEYLAIECADLRDPRSPRKEAPEECVLHEIRKVFLLDSSYQPGPSWLRFAGPLRLAPGEMHSFTLSPP